MQQIEFDTPGPPVDVVRLADAPSPPSPAGGQVLVKVVAFQINPADLLTLQGVYPRLDPQTRAIGNEAVGEIAAVGAEVQGLHPGDRVILLGLNNWRAYRLVGARDVIKIKADGPLHQQAGLKVNPATAQLLLETFVDLKPGDWIVQNAANSAVGRCVIQLARLTGVRTLNVVRRAEAIAPLQRLGADAVLLDGDDLASRAQEATASAAISLALDSVAGAATDRMVACLADGGTLVTYGAMSGAPCQIAPGTLVFKDLRVRGFWLSKFMMIAPRERLVALYQRLDDLVTSGRLVTAIDAHFPVGDIKAAIAKASQPGIDGKVIVSFD